MSKKKSKKGQEKEFVLSEGALEIHRKFQEKMGPSIMGDVCPTLMGLNIDLHKEQGLRFLGDIIESMKKDPNVKFTSEQWHDLPLTTLEEFIPKAIKDRKWIYDLQEFIGRTAKNYLRVIMRRDKKMAPLFYINESTKKEYENPDLIRLALAKTEAEYNEILNEIDIAKIFDQANLTERELRICDKKKEGFTENEIANKLGVSRSTIKRDWAKTREKTRAVMMRKKDV